MTPANVLPTLVAFVLAGMLGAPGGGPAFAPRTGPAVTASIHAAAPQGSTAQGSTAQGSQAQNQGRASTATDALHPVRAAQNGGSSAGHAGPGAALAALSFRLSLDRLGEPIASTTGGRPAGIHFSSFRSRAPPRSSW
jgi:hypothetical protein